MVAIGLLVRDKVLKWKQIDAEENRDDDVSTENMNVNKMVR